MPPGLLEDGVLPGGSCQSEVSEGRNFHLFMYILHTN